MLPILPAEEISNLVKDLVENDHVISAMLSEPGGKLVVEVGAKVRIKVFIITSGICYFGIMEIRKVYRSKSLVKERADRRNLSV